MIEIDCVAQVGNGLGEGPWWDADAQALWWVDAWASTVWRLGTPDRAPVPHRLPAPIADEPIGSMVLDMQGRVVCSTRRELWRVGPERGQATRVACIETDRPATNRLNDGKCDRAGRFWCGSLNTDWSVESGALYRVGVDHRVERLVDPHGISNGIAFSPDDRIFYLADSRNGVVWRYDFDLDAGALSNRRPFIDMSHIAGQVDGATVDSDGCYWCALFGAGAVACFDPDGRLVRRIELPTRDPTMCTFGDADLGTLYVTTARRFLDEGQLARQPLAGALLAIRGSGARGLPEPRFRG